MLTLLDLGIISDCYKSGYTLDSNSSGVYRESCNRLCDLGLIVEDFNQQGLETRYFISNKGRAHIISLLKTPFPKMGWFNNNGDIIDIDGIYN